MFSKNSRSGAGEPVGTDQPFVDFRPDGDPLDTLMRGIWQPHFSSAYTVAAPTPELVQSIYQLGARWANDKMGLSSGAAAELPEEVLLGDAFHVSRPAITVSGSSFRASSHRANGVDIPAGAFHLLIEHRDRDFPERLWRVALGGKALPTDPTEPSLMLLSVSSSFKDNKPAPIPFSSVPFLSYLSANLPTDGAIYSGRTQLRKAPVVVNSTEALFDLFMALTDETRRHPVVLVSGQGGRDETLSYLIDPNRLARSLGGLAQVYVESPHPLRMGSSRGLTDILADNFDISPEYGVWGGAIRVYRPGDIFASPPRAHRYLSGAHFRNEDELGETLRQGCYILSRHDLSTDKRAPVGSETDIERLRQAEHLEMLRTRPAEPTGSQSIEDLETQVREWRDMAESFANDNSKLQREIAEAYRRNSEVSDKLRSAEWLNEQLREDNASLRQQMARSAPSAEDNTAIDPATLIDGASTLRAIKAAFAGRIETTRRFDRTLTDFEPNDTALFEKVFEAVADMDDILWREKFENRNGSFVTEFNSRSRFALTMTETRLTKQKPGMAEMRADSHNGESFEAWSHVKHGNKPGEQFRIHFIFFEDTQKIVLSWVGDHMPTSSSGKSGGRRG